MTTAQKLDFALTLHGGKEAVKVRISEGMFGEPLASINGGLFGNATLSASQIGELLAMFQELDSAMRNL
jgi:hypothetical protein